VSRDKEDAISPPEDLLKHLTEKEAASIVQSVESLRESLNKTLQTPIVRE